MKEEVREKKKMNTREGRKPRIIYVRDREVALQLDNQLGWGKSLATMQDKKKQNNYRNK